MASFHKIITYLRGFFRNNWRSVFLFSIGLLILLLTVGWWLRRETPDEQKTVQPKNIEVYSIGEAPALTFMARVDKAGVVTVQAQSPGVINWIGVTEGDWVKKGSRLVQIGATYNTGSVQGAQAAVARKQYELAKLTRLEQEETLKIQREIAQQVSQNASDLREIARDSAAETRGVVDINNQLLDTIENNLQALEALPQNEQTETQIFSTRQLQSQLRAANTQLNSSLRNADYQGSDQNAPAQLSDLQRELTLQQLDTQEKTLILQEEIARLGSHVAGVSAAVMSPTAPIAGVVERINVKKYDSVNPGQVLLTITGTEVATKLSVALPKTIATKVSLSEMCTIFTDDGLTFLVPVSFIASEAADDGMYYATIVLDKENDLVDGGYVRVELPISLADASSSYPSLPIDAVFQLQNSAHVHLFIDGKAEQRSIQLGEVFGSMVEVKDGLLSGDQVILNRNVNEGDLVRLE